MNNKVYWSVRPIVCLALLAWLLGLPFLGEAWARKPLLIEGKKTLFQRVVTHPGAKLYSSPDPNAAMVQNPVKSFSVFYVFQRRDGGEWMEVGPSSEEPLGWMQTGMATDWRQSLTLVFNERTGRQPVLFFKDRQGLEAANSAPSVKYMAQSLLDRFQSYRASGQNPPASFPVLAMEPSAEAVPRAHFYLMPILQTTQGTDEAKFLQVASVDPGSEEEQAPVAPERSQAANQRLSGEPVSLKTGIAFVMDTTISMQPYIERSRQAVRTMYDTIQKAGLAGNVAFAVVVYRNSTKKTPGLEYTSKVICDFKDGNRRDALEAALSQVREATVSSHSFSEDALAGVKTALDQLDWQPYQGRLIYLITDAGTIPLSDPYNSTGMNEEQVGELAKAKGISIFALHLKTPAGAPGRANNHALAAQQYHKLTSVSDSTLVDLYVPLEANDTQLGVSEFGRAVEGVAGQMKTMVELNARGEPMPPPDPEQPKAKDPVDEAIRKAGILGYAIQLDYLGQRRGAQAPRVVSSWVSDMDLANGQAESFRIAVLLSKNQLSDLQKRLKIILDEAQRSQRTGSKDFFQSIVSAAAQMTRDPAAFSRRPGQNLQQLGVLAEFMEDLPYKSKVMNVTEDDWYRMSVGEQQTFIDSLVSKVRFYAEYYNDNSNWESFGSKNPGDYVCRMPLSQLP